MRTLAERAHGKGLELACRIRPDLPDGRHRRCRSPQAGAHQPGRQCDQVHRARRGPRDRRARARSPEIPTRPVNLACHGERHGGGHSRGEAGSDLRAVRTGGRVDDETIRGNRSGTGHRQPADRADGRPDHGGEPARRGEHLPILGAAGEDPSRSPTGSPTRTHGQLAGLSVLVVDDNATNRRILEEVLLPGQWSRPWWTVDRRPCDALKREAAGGTPFAAVLLDLMMPGMDGMELARQIRMLPGLGDIPLIVLTSGGTSSSISRCGPWASGRSCPSRFVSPTCSRLSSSVIGATSRTAPRQRPDSDPANARQSPARGCRG